jgi:hypothetical protein
MLAAFNFDAHSGDALGSLAHAGSSLEHFARTVSPRNWKQVFILMLTVCFDAGGKEEDHDFVVVAGFAGFAEIWNEFDIEWQARLDKDRLPYFHSGDFSQSRNLFKTGWRDNEPRRRRLCQDLMQIIVGHGLRKFGTVIHIKTQRNIDPDIRKAFLLDGYVQGARDSVTTFNQYAKRIGVTRNVRYVFEKGDREHELRRRFNADGLNEPDFTWKSRHTNRKGFTYDGFLGLQAAGWIAYEYFLDMKCRNEKYERTAEARWAVAESDKIPGIIEAQDAEAAKGRTTITRQQGHDALGGFKTQQSEAA